MTIEVIELSGDVVTVDEVDVAAGAPGKSAFQLAVEAGFGGTLSDWTAILIHAITSATVTEVVVLTSDEYDAIDPDATPQHGTTLYLITNEGA